MSSTSTAQKLSAKTRSELTERRRKVEEKVKEHYGRGSTYAFYSELWGEGNNHYGYFPELDSVVTASGKMHDTSYKDASYLLTIQMAQLSGIARDSKVIDLGCGYGKPILDVHIKHGCAIVGVDLSSDNIAVAKRFVHRFGIDQRKAAFFQGSFLELPSAVWKQRGTFTHVFSQAAFCHAHSELCTVVANACTLLKAGGLAVINDCVSDNEANADTRKYVYEPMCTPHLVTSSQYLAILQANGFQVLAHQSLDKHLYKSYNVLCQRALHSGRDALALEYKKTCESIKRREFGLVTILARKKPVSRL